MGTTVAASMKAEPANLPRYLAYALPIVRKGNESKVKSFNAFILHDEPMGSSVSYLDYDGVVLYAGAFECVKSNPMAGPTMVCRSHWDLDLREHELYSFIQHGRPVIFLVAYLPESIGFGPINPQYDLFRRFAQKIGLTCAYRQQPLPSVESLVPEFRDYLIRFGTGYVDFLFTENQKDLVKPLCGKNDNLFGLVLAGKVFLLPSPVPKTEEQLEQIIVAAITAVLVYRRRMSSQVPLWVNDFVFSREGCLRAQLEDLQAKALELEGKISTYVDLKGALCYQSEPLVKVITDLMRDFLGVSLTIDDKCIEDATLRDDQGNILAVFEIKGVKGNFKRDNVNQVDSHRERLGVAANTPGVLIMNTFMDAGSLIRKDQQPHPEIIKKAAADGVLLIRTLDLVRYASAVEAGALSKEEFRRTILGESGWLKVESGKASVLRS